MKRIPKAPLIKLTDDEYAWLDSWVRSMKTEHRLCQRARLVLLAAGALATREIGRTVGGTTGTADGPVR